ncbi:MAG: 2-hydroxyacid dehydrogenase, partial [Bacteroidota bacterium]
MQTTVFSTHQFERAYLEKANQSQHELNLLEARLTAKTAKLAEGSPAVSLFTQDDASAEVLQHLYDGGTRYLALRSAGFNHVDLDKAQALGIRVARVPTYSPYAIAEHAVA